MRVLGPKRSEFANVIIATAEVAGVPVETLRQQDAETITAIIFAVENLPEAERDEVIADLLHGEEPEHGESASVISERDFKAFPLSALELAELDYSGVYPVEGGVSPEFFIFPGTTKVPGDDVYWETPQVANFDRVM